MVGQAIRAMMGTKRRYPVFLTCRRQVEGRWRAHVVGTAPSYSEGVALARALDETAPIKVRPIPIKAWADDAVVLQGPVW